MASNSSFSKGIVAVGLLIIGSGFILYGGFLSIILNAFGFLALISSLILFYEMFSSDKGSSSSSGGVSSDSSGGSGTSPSNGSTGGNGNGGGSSSTGDTGTGTTPGNGNRTRRDNRGRTGETPNTTPVNEHHEEERPVDPSQGTETPNFEGRDKNNSPPNNNMAERDPLQALEHDVENVIQELEDEKSREREVIKHTDEEIQSLQQVLGRLKELEPYLEPLIQIDLSESSKGEHKIREWEAVKSKIEENTNETLDSVQLLKSIQESLNKLEEDLSNVLEDLQKKDEVIDSEVREEEDIESKLGKAEELLAAVEKANRNAEQLMS